MTTKQPKNDHVETSVDTVMPAIQAMTMQQALSTLHNTRGLWYRLLCFHFDLMHFDSLSLARQRLESFWGEYYFSERYFLPSEASYLLDFPTKPYDSDKENEPNEPNQECTVREYLAQMFASKSKRSRGVYAVCTSNDLAPALEKAYGIRPGYTTDKTFQMYQRRFAKRTTAFGNTSDVVGTNKNK